MWFHKVELFLDNKGQSWSRRNEVDMAGLTNRIERFLLGLMEERTDGILEIGRNDLAEQFECAPSQINYVLTTRFTPYKGYYIESRRGGSGYIRIIRLNRSQDATLEELIADIVEGEITCDKARHILNALEEREMITHRESAIMRHAVDDNALRMVESRFRNTLRGQILKNMLLVFLR